VPDSLLPDSGWILTQRAFDNFLLNLDTDRNKAGEKYELIRLKVRKYFEWHGAFGSEELTDDVITRLVRRMDEGEEIQNLSPYIYGIARLRMLEYKRENKRREVTLNDLAILLPVSEAARDEEENDELQLEIREECFQHCLAKLPEEHRQLLIKYYGTRHTAGVQQRRRHLAETLGIPTNGLRMRIFRIKNKLEKCVKRCRLRNNQ
jgi:RNA polymerase sigma factor (sigma-70 family)